MSSSSDEETDIDALDIEEKLLWVEKILDHARDKFDKIPLGDDLTYFIDQLIRHKVLSKTDGKGLYGVKDARSKIGKIHIMLKKKGWESFKKARKLLYEVNSLMKDEDIWSEHQRFEERESEQVDGLSSTEERVLGMHSALNRVFVTFTPSTIPTKELPSYSKEKEDRKNRICLIINNENYDLARRKGTNDRDRFGSTKDGKALESVFKSFGFDVKYHENVTKNELEMIIDEERNDPALEKCISFVAFFLSHGIDGALYCVDGTFILTDHIIGCFKGTHCPALVGIPKWISFVACRGRKYNYEVTFQDHDGPCSIEENVPRQTQSHLLPDCSDFFISYATTKGYFAWRDIKEEKEGTWFVKEMCNVIRKYGRVEDVSTLMCRVNTNIAFGYRMTVKIKEHEIRSVCQMPSHVNMLTHALYL